MFQKTAFRWPPQPSTVIGLGILAGSVCYFVTGDPVWAGVAAGDRGSDAGSLGRETSGK